MENEWLWLCMIPGLYWVDKRNLLVLYKNPDRIRNAPEEEIRQLTFLKEHQKQTLIAWKKRDPEEFLPILKQKGIRFYSMEHECFPENLTRIHDCPYGIFVKGNLPEKGQRCIAIVGARTCTNYGRKIAQMLAAELARKGVAIVSGMAMGIDGIAQAACLEANQMSVAVIGSGCDICYPREHIELYEHLKQKGCVISEYPPGTIPHPSHFPQRNRIISGMSDTVIVVEARKKSGSLITADLALEQGRDVYAVPGRMGDALSEGCNQLIMQGAGIISDLNNLMEALNLVKVTKKSKKENYNLEICENMVYICLDFHGKSLEEIVDCTKYSQEEVLCALLQLQVKGLAVEISQNRYALK